MIQKVHLVAIPKNFWRLLQSQNIGVITGKWSNFSKADAGESMRESLLRTDQPDPKHVPKGFLSVYVGAEQKRFVIPMSYLSMPDFRVLMERTAEEYGFEQREGLQISCEEQDFEEILAKCLMKLKLTSKSKKNDINHN